MIFLLPVVSASSATGILKLSSAPNQISGRVTLDIAKSTAHMPNFNDPHSNEDDLYWHAFDTWLQFDASVHSPCKKLSKAQNDEMFWKSFDKWTLNSPRKTIRKKKKPQYDKENIKEKGFVHVKVHTSGNILQILRGVYVLQHDGFKRSWISADSCFLRKVKAYVHPDYMYHRKFSLSLGTVQAIYEGINDWKTMSEEEREIQWKILVANIQ